MSDFKNYDNGCGGEYAAECEHVPYAMAFVRVQSWEPVLCAEDALKNGTAFRSLIKPFLAKEGYR